MPPPDLTDGELLARVPDPDAVEAFYRRHVDAVLRFVVRRSDDPSDVADVVSATFVEVIASAPRFDARRGEARAWVLGIARNCLNNDRRARDRRDALLRRLGTLPQLADDESEAVARMIDAAAAAAPLVAAMDRLTATERELLELVAYDGLRVSEAAAVLGISAAGARMRLARARRRLIDHAAPSGRLTHEETSRP